MLYIFDNYSHNTFAKPRCRRTRQIFIYNILKEVSAPDFHIQTFALKHCKIEQITQNPEFISKLIFAETRQLDTYLNVIMVIAFVVN